MNKFIVACLVVACFGSSMAKFVGFSVARETAYGPLETPNRLPFEVAFVNTDGCFDLEAGLFTAPVAGHYNFQWNLHTAHSEHPGPIARMVVNSQMKLSAAENGASAKGVNDDVDSASNNAIFEMAAGEQAWLHFDEGRQVTATHGRETTFSAFLID